MKIDYLKGSHKKKNAELKAEDPKFAPLRFIAEDHKSAVLCNCKRSSSRPFCDGKFYYIDL